MSYVLPPEVKTQKHNSLPDELKSIADELIAKKFGFKKEAAPNRRDPFHGAGDFSDAIAFGFNGTTCEPDVGTRRSVNEQYGNIGYGIEVERNPGRGYQVARVRISDPSLELIMRAIMDMDNQNLPGLGRRLVMSPGFFDYVLRQDTSGRVRMYRRPGARDPSIPVAQIFGVDVFGDSGVCDCVLECRF